jgi:hypothetical protein
MASGDLDIGRRDLVGAIGLGMTIASVRRAQAATSAEEPTTAAALEDPTTKYPKPPFPEQRQPWL